MNMDDTQRLREEVAADVGRRVLRHEADMRASDPQTAEAFYRVNDALLADLEAKIPKPCKRCMGSGYQVRTEVGSPVDARWCPACGSTGTTWTNPQRN